MLKKLNQLLAKLPRFLLPALCFILLFVVLSEPTLAEEKVPKTFLETLGGFEKIYSSVILVIVMLTYVFALMVGDLIDSTFILDTGMGDTLHMVWSVVRNFVNIGFILILLVIAAMVVLGGAGDKGLGMLKKVLPKFILALVFVNFTFFAGRFILTTNDVLATAIFALPKTVAGDRMINLPCAPGLSAEACRDEIMKTVTGSYAGDQAVGKDLKEKLTTNIQKLQNTMAEHKIADTIDKKNVALLLVSSMLDLKNLVSSKGVLGGSWDTAISGIMAIITAGAVGIVIFMLMLALIVRMVVLWMCLALSPVAALAVVLGDVIPGASLKGDFDLLGIFIKHAFMPTLVSIPLSIGLIMIFTNNTIKPDSGGVLGSIGGATGAGNFNSLLWWIASIIIIWFGVNTMIKKASPEFASKITDKIHGGVNKAAGTVAGTLKYAPILPSWKDENGDGKLNDRRSWASISQIPRNVSSLLESQSSAGAAESAKEIAPMFGYKPQKMEQSTFNEKAKTIKTEGMSQLIAAFQELIHQGLTGDRKFEGKPAEEFFTNNQTALQAIGITSADALKDKTVRNILEEIKKQQPKNEQAKTALKGLDKNDADFNTGASGENKPAENGIVKNTTGLTNLGAEQLKDKEINKETGLTKNGKKLFEVEIEGKGKVLFTPSDENDPSKGGSVEESREDLDEYVRLLGLKIESSKKEEDVMELAAEINKLADEYGSGVLEQLDFEKSKLAASIKDKLVKGYNITIPEKKKNPAPTPPTTPPTH